MAKFCINCGYTLTENAKFCEDCGSSVAAPMPAPTRQSVCLSCGYLLNPGVKFCKGCGAPSTPVPAPAPVQPVYHAPPLPAPSPYYAPRPYTPKRKGGWLIPYRIVAVILIIALSVNAYKTAVIDPYNRNWQNNNQSSGVAGNGSNNYGYANTSGGRAADGELPYYINDMADILDGDGDIDFSQTYAPIVPEGNSKAFTMTPMAGLTISAGQNALDRDREWNVREVSDAEWAKYVTPLYDADVMVFSAHEVDAGLAPDEMFPGKFQMEFDLATLDVPDFMLGNLAVARIDDNGSISILQSEVVGGKLVCESRQNSVMITIGVSLFVLGTGMLLVDWYEDSQKFDETKYAGLYDKDGTVSIELPRDERVPDPTASVKKKMYRLTYSTAGYPNLEEYNKSKALVELMVNAAKKYRAEVLDQTKDVKKADEAYKRRLTDEINSSAAYRQALDNLSSGEWLVKNTAPPEVITAIEAIEAADSYIRSITLPNTVFWPTEQIDIVMLPKLAGDGTLAMAVSPKMGAPYIQLNTEEIKKSRDNAFITVAHEMLHVYQPYYVYKNDSDSYLQFWEATARYFEAQVAADYLRAGIIDAIPKLTPNEYYEYLVRGNEWTAGAFTGQGSDSSSVNTQVQQYGYTLSNFLFYLRDAQGIDFKVQDLLEGFRKTSSHRGAIIHASKGALDDSLRANPAKAYDTQWAAFCKVRKDDFYGRYGMAALYQDYGIKEAVFSKANQKITFNYIKMPFSSSFLQRLRTDEKEYSYLVVKPPGFSFNPAYTFGLKSNNQQYGTNEVGMMASAGNKIWIEGNNDPDFVTNRDSIWVQFTLFWSLRDPRIELSAHTSSGRQPGISIDTDIYLLPKPDKPTVTVSAKGDSFTVNYPQWSQAYRDGHMTGVLVDFDGNFGNYKIEPFTILSKDLDNMPPFARSTFTQSGSETKVTVRVAEYLDTAYGIVQGPYSEPATFTLPQLEEMFTSTPAPTKEPEATPTPEAWDENIQPEITAPPQELQYTIIDMVLMPGLATLNGVENTRYVEVLDSGSTHAVVTVGNVTHQEFLDYYEMLKNDKRYARSSDEDESGYYTEVYKEPKLLASSDNDYLSLFVVFNPNLEVGTIWADEKGFLKNQFCYHIRYYLNDYMSAPAGTFRLEVSDPEKW